VYTALGEVQQGRSQLTRTPQNPRSVLGYEPYEQAEGHACTPDIRLKLTFRMKLVKACPRNPFSSFPTTNRVSLASLLSCFPESGGAANVRSSLPRQPTQQTWLEKKPSLVLRDLESTSRCSSLRDLSKDNCEASCAASCLDRVFFKLTVSYGCIMCLGIENVPCRERRYSRSRLDIRARCVVRSARFVGWIAAQV
jgi:hypothetical protein